MIGSDKYYKKMVWRSLNWDRTDQSLELCNQFVHEVIGRGYKFDYSQLIKRDSIPLQVPEETKT